MAQGTLNVELRDATGNQAAKSVRSSGRIPGVYYAHGEDSFALSVNAKELQKLMQTEVNILDVVFPDGQSKKCILKDVQKDQVIDLIDALARKIERL